MSATLKRDQNVAISDRDKRRSHGPHRPKVGSTEGQSVARSDLVVLSPESRQKRKDFLSLPWKINAGDPLWAPPMRGNQKALCGFSRHPFYEDALAKPFLVLRKGKVVGRVLAVVNHAYNRTHEKSHGFFGFFECVNDKEVARLLLREAEDWLCDAGAQAVQGPTNPAVNYEWGTLVEGFDAAPFFMTPHNRPYYAELIESAGYEKAQDLYAFWGEMEEMAPLVRAKTGCQTVPQLMEKLGVTLRTLNPREFQRDLKLFLELYNGSMSSTWGHVPLSDNELGRLAHDLRSLIVPEFVLFAESQGKPIGVALGLLDYNPRVREIDGRLFPFGFLKLIRKKKSIRRLRVVSANVVPEHWGRGVGVALVAELLLRAEAAKVNGIEFSWVLESNHLSSKTLESCGAKRYKTYRIYEKTL